MKKWSWVTALMLAAVMLMAVGCSDDDDGDTGNKPTGPRIKAPNMGGRTLPQGLRQPANAEMQEVGGAGEAALGGDWGDDWFTYEDSWDEYDGGWDWWDGSSRQSRPGWAASAEDSACYELYSPEVQDTVIWSWKDVGSEDEWEIVAPYEGGYLDVLDAEQAADGSDGLVEFLPNIVEGETGYYDWYEWAWETSQGDFYMTYTGVVDAYNDGQTIWVTMATFEMYFDADGSGYIAYWEDPNDPYPLWSVSWDAEGDDGTWTYGFEESGDWDDWSAWDDSWDSEWDEGWDDYEDDGYDDWGEWWGKISGSPLGSIPIKARNR